MRYLTFWKRHPHHRVCVVRHLPRCSPELHRSTSVKTPDDLCCGIANSSRCSTMQRSPQRLSIEDEIKHLICCLVTKAVKIAHCPGSTRYNRPRKYKSSSYLSV